MAWDIEIGDEITLTATIIKVLPSGRASVSIPTYDFPFAIDAPKKKRSGDKVSLVGRVIRVDDQDGKVTVKVGGLVTVDIASITAHGKRPKSKSLPSRDWPD
ncbi:hypothetical protein HB777_33805 [Mesorhizobium loti]|nr:hypothetical protein HB777_33805 [Mesorhizobium loti]